MSKLKVALPAAIMMAGFLLSTTASYGTAENTKQTKKACKYCHTVALPKTNTPEAKQLTDAGKYFKDKKTLDGYVEKK